jgi:hypothetical protein
MAVSDTSIAFGVFIPPLLKAMSWSHSALSYTYALSSMVTRIGVLVVGSLVQRSLEPRETAPTGGRLAYILTSVGAWIPSGLSRS